MSATIAEIVMKSSSPPAFSSTATSSSPEEDASLPELDYDEKIASLENKIKSAHEKGISDGADELQFSDFDPTDSIKRKPLSMIGDHEKLNFEPTPLQPIEEKHKFLKKRRQRKAALVDTKGQGGDDDEEEGASLLVRKDQNAVASSPSRRKKLRKKLSRRHAEGTDETRAYGTIKSCSRSRQEMSRKSIFHKKTSCSFTEQQLNNSRISPQTPNEHPLSSSEIEDCQHSEMPRMESEAPGNFADAKPRVVYAHKHKVKRKSVSCNYAALIADTLNDSKTENNQPPPFAKKPPRKRSSHGTRQSSRTSKMPPIAVAATSNNSTFRKVVSALCFPCCRLY